MEVPEKRSTRPKTRQSLAHVPPRSKSDDLDAQNKTIDVSALDRTQRQKIEKSKKRSRGKSLGPGGIETLTEKSHNASKIIAYQPKSILKPTVPLTPPKTIPSFDELRKKSATKTKSPRQNNADDLLIDFSTPAPTRDAQMSVNPDAFGTGDDPFSPIKVNAQPKVGDVHDEAEEHKRQAEKNAILERRAARRKSMANRRVSFAPEATLHTWSVMELQEDSTTSSASNSTRRQSSTTAMQSASEDKDPVIAERVVSPAKQEELLVAASPARLADFHENGRRKSSSSLPAIDVAEDAVYSSSPSGDVTTESSPVRVEDSIDSESDTDGDTAMSMDDATSQTVNSQSSSTHSSLDERLRQAASLAGTRGIDYDEYGEDLSMEIADGTVTNAFQPWAKQHQLDNNVAAADQENIYPVLPDLGHEHPQAATGLEDDDTEGLTMEMTKAVGSIISFGTPTKSPNQKSASKRRKSNVTRRRSSMAGSDHGDETMDMTMVAGGILPTITDAYNDADELSDQDLSMDMTKAVGGLVPDHNRLRFTHSATDDENETMDMTTAFGGILAPIEEQTEPQTDVEDDRTTAMEMTHAVGKIMTGHASPTTSEKTPPVSRLDEAAGVSSRRQSTRTPLSAVQQLTSIASETGSPSLAMKPRPSARPKSASASRSVSPGRNVVSRPASKTALTPEKQVTPLPSRAITPERTPMTMHISTRSASPKKLFQKELESKPSPRVPLQSQSGKADPLFAKDLDTGRQTPKYVLHAPKPHQHLRRRSSGIGIDKEGFGSPRITELLDRRSSIHEAAPEFHLEVFQKGNIRFADPKQLEREVDADRADEERRESGRFILEQEVDEQQEENVTLQLKELINSMTPKKKKTEKLKGRKSLAVGSARGLLGKRPAELDDRDEEEEDVEHTPKRLKAVSREASPVKAVHLPKPPTKEETTGRISRSQRLVLDAQYGHHTPVDATSPTKQDGGASPQVVGRFKDVDSHIDHMDSFGSKLDNVVGAVDPSILDPSRQESAVEDKISLQDFLHMTNIHFIELSTTKRRHTVAPSAALAPMPNVDDRAQSLAASFLAAATTIPLLELYQHATRELKTYISSGRKIIRSIEAETLAEQPPLFREYVEARPDMKLVMDNQFKNGKSNARLQSKEGWYAWRSQLVDGLYSGLKSIKSDMQQDAATLENQLSSLALILPQLRDDNQSLQQERGQLEMKIEHVDSVDQEELKQRRLALQATNSTLADKLAFLKTLREQIHDKEEALGQAAELKTEIQGQIDEANRVKAEHQGWAARDVLALKTSVDLITETTGWSILTVEDSDQEDIEQCGIALTLCYKDALRLFFYPMAFERATGMQARRSGRRSNSLSQPTAPISLSLIQSADSISQEMSTDRRFFLQLIRSQLHVLNMMPKGSVSTKQVLSTVSAGWDMAGKVSEEICMLNMAGLTRISIRNDETLAITCMLITGTKTRADIDFVLSVDTGSVLEMSSSMEVSVTALYGPVTSLQDDMKGKKFQTALKKAVDAISLGDGALIAAVHRFEEWHNSQSNAKKISKPSRNTRDESAERGRADIPMVNQVPSSPLKPLLVPQRSPLAAKRATALQKKALPVPTTRHVKLAKEVIVDKQHDMDKENVDIMKIDSDQGHKPAITPEMQEAMMHTPIKRVGALRRSPIGGGW